MKQMKARPQQSNRAQAGKKGNGGAQDAVGAAEKKVDDDSGNIGAEVYIKSEDIVS